LRGWLATADLSKAVDAVFLVSLLQAVERVSGIAKGPAGLADVAEVGS